MGGGWRGMHARNKTASKKDATSWNFQGVMMQKCALAIPARYLHDRGHAVFTLISTWAEPEPAREGRKYRPAHCELLIASAQQCHPLKLACAGWALSGRDKITYTRTGACVRRGTLRHAALLILRCRRGWEVGGGGALGVACRKKV